MAKADNQSRRVPRETWLLIAVLVFIAIVAVSVLAVTWDKSFKLEAAKAAMSVLTVAVFGGLATFALERYRLRRETDAATRAQEEQSEKEKQATEAQEAAAERIRQEENSRQEVARLRDKREREQATAAQEAAAERIRQEENWRRDAARLRDKREREDALLRSLLEETLRSYNQVKRARRLLRAYTQDGSGHSVSLSVYDRHLKDLNDEQLAFEQFKRLTPAHWAERSELQSLSENYETIERYLNELVKEYEVKRHLVKSSGGTGMPLAEFERLSGFFESHYSVKDEKGNFYDIGLEPNVSKQIDKIIEQVQGALLAPLDLPSVAQRQ